MKRIAFIIYAWGSTALYIFFLFWLATVPRVVDEPGTTAELIKIIYRLVLYGFLFLLLYRSIIATLRFTVDRLSKWHSQNEKQEDAEFVLVIETLVTLLAVTTGTIIAFIEELIQSPYGQNIAERSFEIQDILVSIMGILLASMVVYSMPIIGDLEVTLHTKTKAFLQRFKN